MKRFAIPAAIAAYGIAAGLLTGMVQAKPMAKAKPHAAPRATLTASPGDVIIINGVSYTVVYGLSPLLVTPPPPVVQLAGFSTDGPTFSAGQVVTGTLNLSGPAPAGGATVTLLSGNPGVLPLPASVPFPAGASQGSFSATAGAPTVTTPVTVAAASGGATLTASVTVLGNNSAPMQLWGYRDGQRNWALNFGVGQTIFLEGIGFGAVPGKVTVNNNVIPTLAWSDGEIEIVCPPLPTGAPAGKCLLDIRRVDGQDWNTSMGFGIIPPPGKRPAGG